ncbi:MAG: plastocyanin/azurin family copper-binding protein [Planctomycetota bacterium]
MKTRFALPLLLAAILSVPAFGQATPTGALALTHVVDVTGFSFIDTVSGTNVTTVTCGETIEWLLLDTFAHLVLDGASPRTRRPARDSTSRFDTFGGGTSHTWVADEVGTFPYYCAPHFGFGMVGTIVVLPAPNVLAGSGEDFTLDVLVDGVTACGGTDSASVGSVVACHFESPAGTFNGYPPILAAELFPTGMGGPGSPVGFPYIHVTLNAYILFNGLQAAPFGAAVLAPGGYNLFGVVSPNLVGSTLRLQALVLAGIANDGIFAFSDSYDLDLVP